MGIPKLKVVMHLRKESPLRRNHCTIAPSVVRSAARKALRQALPWRNYGQRVTRSKLLDVLLLAATLASSLSSAVDEEGGELSAVVGWVGVAVAAGMGVADEADSVCPAVAADVVGGSFPPAQLREWLADLLKSKYKEEKEIRLGFPLLLDNLKL